MNFSRFRFKFTFPKKWFGETLTTRFNHPKVGLNLLMVGTDLVGGVTYTPVVSLQL